MTSIKLDHITKVEGHARLDVEIDGSGVKLVSLDVYEGARYFEAFVRGRSCTQVPSITSRICGICSQAHTLVSLQAIENALGVKPSKQTEALRNLLHLGSMIQSHALHLYFLALPDYLGFGDAISMAAKYPSEVKRGLKLKKLGNRICEEVSGRQIHSISAVVGGFSKVPLGLNELKEELLSCREDACKTVSLFARLKVPKFDRKTLYASLKTKPFRDYSALSGNIQAGAKTFLQGNYRKFLVEHVVKTSTSKHVTLNGSAVMVGSLARLNNNRQNLSANARKMLAKLKFPSHNPFHNNLCQAIEIVSFVDRCIDIICSLQLKEESPVKFKMRSGTGVSVIEAPRGLLVHECKINAKGLISDYNIIAPTTINLQNIEEDIRAFLPHLVGKKEKQIIAELERLIRAYDPCISCSAHFLEVNWKKR